MRILLLLILLASCSSPPPVNTMTGFYECPYEDVAIGEKHVSSVEELPWEEYNQRRSGYYIYGLVTIDGVVKIYPHLDRYSYDLTYWHEVCHLYEYYELGISWADTYNHVGWEKVL